MAEDAAEDQNEEKPSFLSRLLASRFALIGAVGSVLLLSGLLGYFVFLSDSEKEEEEVSLQSAIEMYQRQEYVEARRLALKLVDSEDLAEDEKGIPVFLIAMELVKNKCELETQQASRQGLYLIASKYFDEAALRGVPPHMVPITNYWWGKSLYLATEIPAARGPLLVALNGLPAKRKELLGLLADVYLEDPKLDPTEGIRYINSLLTEFADELDLEEIHLGEVKKARLISKAGKFKEAVTILERLPVDSPLAGQISYQIGRVYLDEAKKLIELRKDKSEIQQAYKNAATILKELPLIEIDDEEKRAAALMDLGLAFKGMGDFAEAEKSFAYVRRQFFDQPVGIAAGFYEAHCKLEGKDSEKAMATFIRLLREVVQTNIQGESKWVNSQFLNEVLRDSAEVLIERDQCKDAVELTKKFRVAAGLREPKVPLDVVAELEVATYSRWVQLLEQKIEDAKYVDKPVFQAEWREKQRLLGHALFSLARHRFAGEEHAKELFQAGEAFFRAEDYERSVLTLRQYLDTNDKFQPSKARLLIGKCYFAEGKFDNAIESFSYCWVVHPNDPSVYEARLWSAECYLELGDPNKAREMLNGNLDDGKLTPRSKEWIESKYLMGNIYYEEALLLDAQSRSLPPPTVGNDTQVQQNVLLEKSADKYRKAIRQLNEALARQPDIEQASIGRYRLAESYRRIVAWTEVQLTKTTRNNIRLDFSRKINQSLLNAIEHLDLLEDRLAEMRDQRPLDEIERGLLRNSFFIRGRLYYRLNKYEKAIKLLQSASNMVLQEPEVLEAYAQMAQCYRHLGRKDDVKRVIDQAKILLRDRIPKDADFQATTRFPSRERWLAHLNWLSSI